MTALDSTTGAETSFALVLCVCGHTRAGHKFGLANGAMRYLACGQGRRGHCDEFEEQEAPDAATDVPEVADEPPPVITTPPRESAVPAVDLAIEPVREPWAGHRCPECGRTYRHPYSDHGAPSACPGRLEPVTVGDQP